MIKITNKVSEFIGFESLLEDIDSISDYHSCNVIRQAILMESKI